MRVDGSIPSIPTSLEGGSLRYLAAALLLAGLFCGLALACPTCEQQEPVEFVIECDGTVRVWIPEDGFSEASYRNQLWLLSDAGWRLLIPDTKELDGGEEWIYEIPAGPVDLRLVSQPGYVYPLYRETDDGCIHWKAMGGDLWGVEDLYGLGDRDYDDLMVFFSIAEDCGPDGCECFGGCNQLLMGILGLRTESEARSVRREVGAGVACFAAETTIRWGGNALTWGCIVEEWPWKSRCFFVK